MNIDNILKSFCYSVIVDHKRDRIYHELVSKKRKGIDRFNHNLKDLIKEESVILRCSLDDVINYIFNDIKSFEEIMVIDCFNPEFKILIKEDFIKMISSSYLAVIGITSSNLAIIKEEGNSGKCFYLLRI